jgi:hypothetical protein
MANHTIQKVNLPRLCLVIAVVALSGCKSPIQYTSPQVEGRVVDAQSHEPLKNVFVQRIDPNAKPKRGQQAKGAQLMDQAGGVRTAADGTFKLDSVKSLTFLRRLNWYSVTVSFKHHEYLPLSTNYTAAEATNTVDGEPIIITGDISLKPIRALPRPARGLSSPQQ